MLLSVRMLQSVNSVNDYDVTDQFVLTAGDTVTVYFQLVDLSKDRAALGNNPPGRRYIPASGATLTATLLNIDSSKKINARACSQPFSTTDPSIWSFTITSADTITGTCRLQVALTQSSVVTRGSKESAVLIYPSDP